MPTIEAVQLRVNQDRHVAAFYLFVWNRAFKIDLERCEKLSEMSTETED